MDHPFPSFQFGKKFLYEGEIGKGSFHYEAKKSGHFLGYSGSLIRRHGYQVHQHTPLMSALGRQRRVDFCELEVNIVFATEWFKDSQSYTVRTYFQNKTKI